MIFKTAQASMPIYLFDRSNISMLQGKVTSVQPSHIDIKMSGKMVVDITASIDGKSQTYTIEDALTTAYLGNTIISLDREAILREIEATKSASEQILQDVDRHKEVVTKCHQLLLENNPQLKEQKQVEERFSNLENKIDKLSEMMEKFMN